MTVPKNGMHYIFLYADSPSEWNCSEWRALSPSNSINAEHAAGRTPHTAQLFHLPSALNWSHPEVQKKVGLGDVLIFQRNCIAPEVWNAMDYWRALGKLVVVDLDDGYPLLPPSNPAFTYWIRNINDMNPDPVTALEEGLRHADALISPGKVILQDWAHVVRGYWIPNWTRRAWYTGLQQKPMGAPDVIFSYEAKEGVPELVMKFRENSEDWQIIGWGGSISHVDSWMYSGIVEALDRIFEKWPNAHLKFCGSEARLDAILKRWGERVIRQEGVKPEHWPMVLSTFDIGVAPLDMRPLEPWRPGAPVAAYDERRSWLKGIEYLSAGVPWVGSKSLTYNDLAQHGTLCENTSEGWFRALDNKLQSLSGEKGIAWKRRTWALKKVTFEANVGNYAGIFERIIAEKSVRNGARLPDIIYIQQQVAPAGT